MHDGPSTQGTAPEAQESRASVAEVLLVDDSPSVRTSVGNQLRKAGFRVDEAANGQFALEQLTRTSYDVVVTDLNMPHFDGFHILEHIGRWLDARADVPKVIVLTGTHATDAESAVRAFRLGACDFVAKGSKSAGEVVTAVQRALERRNRDRARSDELLAELRLESRTDSLTRLLNRRAFDEDLCIYVRRARRFGADLSAVLIDVDQFKSINDRYGHLWGDAVLRAVAQRCADQRRTSDRIYRLGGDEIAILLPDTPRESAVQMAARLVRSVADLPVFIDGLNLQVTISAGVSSMAGDRITAEGLLDEADRCLYHAKRGGRNQIAQDPDPSPRRKKAP